MKKLFYFDICLLLCICLFCSCNIIESTDNASVALSDTSKMSVRTTKPPSINYREGYPRIIDSLNLQELYDSTKWYLYVYHSMSNPMIIDYNDGSKTPLNYNFCSLELRFHSVEVFNDTTKIYFYFYVNDSTVLNIENFSSNKLKHLRDYSSLEPYINGRMFSKYLDSKHVCYLIKGTNFGYICVSPLPRLPEDTVIYRIYQPLQPDVIVFINENKEKLHPWFYKEAVRRGVIKEDEQK